MEKYRGKIVVRRLKNKNNKLNLSIKNKDIDYITRPQFPYNFLQCCPAMCALSTYAAVLDNYDDM